MNTHTKGIEQCHHGLLTEEAGGFRPRAPPAPPVGGAWAWGSRRLGLGAEGRSAWEEGLRGALPPVSVGTSSPWSGEMLAAQPQAVRQDLSQIKGTCGIHSQHEGSP